MSDPPRPLLLAITGNQTLTEKVLTLRGHVAQVATERRTQYLHGKAIEHAVNLLGTAIAVSEPDDYREILEATGIIGLVSKKSGEPLRVSQKDWDAWLSYMEKECQKREAGRKVQNGPPCAVGDRVIVRWSKDRLEEGVCEWVGKKYLRLTPLLGAGNVVTAPFRLVVRFPDDPPYGRAAGVELPPAKRRRKRGGRSRRQRHLDKIHGL